jgi:hypothetical protein
VRRTHTTALGGARTRAPDRRGPYRPRRRLAKRIGGAQRRVRTLRLRELEPIAELRPCDRCPVALGERANVARLHRVILAHGSAPALDLPIGGTKDARVSVSERRQSGLLPLGVAVTLGGCAGGAGAIMGTSTAIAPRVAHRPARRALTVDRDFVAHERGYVTIGCARRLPRGSRYGYLLSSCRGRSTREPAPAGEGGTRELGDRERRGDDHAAGRSVLDSAIRTDSSTSSPNGRDR